VFRISDLLARIDVYQHGHWSLLSFRFAPMVLLGVR
jgi:hypothetical protein